MPNRDTAEAPERDPRLERLSALTDGVYAIAMTLLAVELALPEAAAHLHGGALLESLLKSWPKVLGFLTSFTVIAIFWIATTQFYQQVLRLDGKLLSLAMVKLACIAFLPFPTGVLGQHVSDPVAQQFYFASLLAAGLASAAVCWYATWQRRRLMNRRLPARVLRHYRLLIGVGVPGSFLSLMALTAAGIGRLINPVVLAYLLTLGYALVVAFEWWEPRGAGSSPAHEYEPDGDPPGSEDRTEALRPEAEQKPDARPRT